MHRLTTTCLVALACLALTTTAFADDPKPAPKPVEATALDVPGPITAIADTGALWLASDTAGLLRYEAAKGVTWRKPTGLKGVRKIDPASAGDLVLLTTAKELVAWNRATGKAAWRIPAPKSSAWSKDGSSVHTVDDTGVIRTLLASSGKETDAKRVAHRGDFREVTLHGPSGLAIFGFGGG